MSFHFLSRRITSRVFFFFYSAGGLVTAVAPVVISGNGVWVGWPGMHMENPNEPIPESDPNDRTPTAGLLSRKVSPHRVNMRASGDGTAAYRKLNRHRLLFTTTDYRVIRVALYKRSSCVKKNIKAKEKKRSR